MQGVLNLRCCRAYVHALSRQHHLVTEIDFDRLILSATPDVFMSFEHPYARVPVEVGVIVVFDAQRLCLLKARQISVWKSY